MPPVEILLPLASTLGWRLGQVSDTEVEFIVPLSWRSWGEVVTLRVASPGEGTVQSRSRTSLQPFDGGQNERNVRRLLVALDMLNTVARGGAPSKPSRR